MRRVMWTLALVCGLMMLGCSASHWGGEATQNPGFRYETGILGTKAQFDTKGTAEVESVVYGKDSLDVKGVKLAGDPTGLALEQAAKLKEITELQRVQVEYITAVMTGLTNIVRELAPMLEMLAMGGWAVGPDGCTTCTLPSSSQATPDRMAKLTQQAMAALEAFGKIKAAMPAASQPAPATQ